MRFPDERGNWPDCGTIGEYREEVAKRLVMYTPWHYDEKSAKERVEAYSEFVRKAFSERVPAKDCAIDIGYSCG